MELPDMAPLRDIICCLQNFPLKKEILNQARKSDQIIFNDSTITLFHGLSPITLQNTRAMRPLLDELREKGIVYKWRFPFALQATLNGKRLILRMLDKIPDFCADLSLLHTIGLSWDFSVDFCTKGRWP